MKTIFKNVIALLISLMPIHCQAACPLPYQLLAQQVNGKIYVPAGSVIIAPGSINIHFEDGLVPVLSIHVDNQGIYVKAAELKWLINNPYYMKKFIQERQIIISSSDRYPANGCFQPSPNMYPGTSCEVYPVPSMCPMSGSHPVSPQGMQPANSCDVCPSPNMCLPNGCGSFCPPQGMCPVNSCDCPSGMYPVSSCNFCPPGCPSNGNGYYPAN